MKWSGFIEVDISGDYVFKLENRDGARMTVMGNLLINNWGCLKEMTAKEGAITFNRKGYYPIQVEFFAVGSMFGMMLTWKKPGDDSFVAVPESKLSHIPDGSFTYTTEFIHYYQNVKIPDNTPVFIGVTMSNPVFTSDPVLPSGLTLQSNGVISGTPSNITSETTYVITATSGGLSLSTKIVFDVSYVAPPTSLLIKGEDGEEVNEVIVQQFTDMSPLILECDKDSVTWSIEPDLPLGMSIDHAYKRIKGWPKASLSRTRFTVSASNSGGSVQKILYVTVTGCEYGQYLYTPNVTVMGGQVVVTKDNQTFFEQFVNNTEYSAVLCLPRDTYNLTLVCSLPQQVPCFLTLLGEDGFTYMRLVIPGHRVARAVLSTNVTKKPTIKVASSKSLRVREHFSLTIEVEGVYSPLMIQPSLPSGVTLSGTVLSGAFMDQGTFIFTVSTSNEAGEDKAVIEFDVGTCPDNESLMILYRSYGRRGESLTIYTMSRDVVLEARFSNAEYEQALCMSNADYQVVMNTTLSSGSWSVGEELLIRDSWNDLLASMSLSDGSGEATEYFTINYAILDDQLMRYSSASMSEEWNKMDFKDSDWSIGSSGGFGHFTRNTVYFRREFSVDNKNKYPIFAFDLEILDGIIAYINGVEVVRRNMPMTGVNENTLATDRYDQLIWHRTSVPSTLLENGRNVLAVELHRYGESSDTRIYFDMYASLLSGTCMLRTDRGYPTDSHHSPNLENPPSAAFDGDLETSWRENNLPVFIQFNYNYDRFESINKVVLRGTKDYSHEHPKRFEIIGMITAEEGDVLAQVDDRNIFTEPQSSVAVVFPNNKSYNGYQIRIEETNDESIYVSIAEVELYTCHFVYCPKEKGWDSIMTGEISYGRCPRNSFGESTRSCLKNGFDPVWGKVDQSTCLSTHPSSSVAFIDFKYMVSSCTIKNYDTWVNNRLLDVICDRLLVSKDSINIFLKRDCSDSETTNVCFNVRITTDSKVVDSVSKQIVALQQDISYLIYKDAPTGFPSGMYFVMVMNPIVRKPVSVGMIIVIVVVVVVVGVVGSVMFFQRKKRHGTDSSHKNSRKETKSLLRDIDCDCL